MAAAARKPVAALPKSRTARRVGRDWAMADDANSSKQSDANESRARVRLQNCEVELINDSIASASDGHESRRPVASYFGLSSADCQSAQAGSLRYIKLPRFATA